MVTASAARETPHTEARARTVWPAWLGAAGLVLPLLAPLVWSGVRVRFLADSVQAAVDPIFEAPLSVRSPLGIWLLVVLLTWFALAYRSRAVVWWEFALVALAGAMALPRVGNAWLVAPLLIVPLTKQLGRLRPATCLALGAIGLAAASLVLALLRPPRLPEQALQATAGGPGTTFVDYRWATQVGNAHQEFGLDYLRVAQGHERWQAILDEAHVSVVVLDAADRERAAAELVRTSAAWRVLFDQDGVLIAKRAQP